MWHLSFWSAGQRNKKGATRPAAADKSMHPHPPCSSIHFVFLAHGFLGSSDELSFFEEAIQDAVTKTKPGTIADGDDADDVESSVTKTKPGADDDGDDVEVITHRATCNHISTFDGIEAGGKRLAEEVEEFVRSHFQDKMAGVQENEGNTGTSTFHASLSFIGYSLGGMYSRYAISILPMEFDLNEVGRKHQDQTPSVYILHCSDASFRNCQPFIYRSPEIFRVCAGTFFWTDWHRSISTSSKEERSYFRNEYTRVIPGPACSISTSYFLCQCLLNRLPSSNTNRWDAIKTFQFLSLLIRRL